MCTVIVHVPHDDGAPVRLLAVRDEDPQRTWDPLGAWWPELPGVKGVRDRRAGGAWLAVDAEAGRVAVILNRADVLVADPTGQAEPPVSRGRIVLDAVAGRTPDSPPHAQGFNLVDAHDDVDDEATARIAAWRDAFTAPDSAHARWWEPWLDTLERTSAVGSTDDRAIVRDNRPFGYPTLSLLVCAVSLGPDGVEARYAEFDEPGRWNRPHLH